MPPLMREAVARVGAARPDVRFVLAQAPTVEAELVARHLAGAPAVGGGAGRADAVMRAADLVLVTSGTATLEAALLGPPLVVCSRVSRLSGFLARLLIRVPWISLANLTLGRAVVPELYQARATAERLPARGPPRAGPAPAPPRPPRPPR